MFVLAQLPLADFRPLIKGEKGRLLVPDWTSDNLNSGFLRGFGKIHARNGSGLGLEGERSFADVNNALRFYYWPEVPQDGWNRPLRLALWFRRFYFDGLLAGRVEIGFMVPSDTMLARFRDQPIDPLAVAKAILTATVQVHSVDGSKADSTFGKCSRALGLAYLASTTRNDALSNFPIGETYDAEVLVGRPTLHIRIPSGLAIAAGKDRRYLSDRDEPEIFIGAARNSEAGNTILVQGSPEGVQDETASERTTRVLFAHLNSLLFAHSAFVKSGNAIGGLNGREALRRAISNMIERLSRFTQVENSETDKAFTASMNLFAKAYAGRIDELVGKLQDLSTEWNKPTTLESFKRYFKGVHDLAVTAAVEKVVETTMKAK
jgi:hypothetical protein